MTDQLLQGEVILIDKPYRWTSFDAVNKIKSLLKNHLGLKKLKVGHAGTLDPLATGLLIICTGKFTKRIDTFQAQEKEYTGSFILGSTTPSFDLETQIDNTFDYSHITDKMILNTANEFIGEILQRPPTFSAKKINGERAYEYARRGEHLVLESKSITIRTFEITKIELPEVFFRIECSKGTYIRSIARDFGEKLNCGAYLNTLCRTRIGEFYLKNAKSISEYENMIINIKI